MQGSGDPQFEKPQRYLTINKIYCAARHTHTFPCFVINNRHLKVR